MHSGVNGIKKHACNCGRVDGGWTGECCRSVLPSFHSPWYSSPLEQLKEPRVRVMGPAGTRQHNRNRHVKPGDFNKFLFFPPVYQREMCSNGKSVQTSISTAVCWVCVAFTAFLTVHHLECAGADTSPVCDKYPLPSPYLRCYCSFICVFLWENIPFSFSACFLSAV